MPTTKSYRRSLSFKPEIYARLKLAADTCGRKMAAIAEDALTQYLDACGVPVVDRHVAKADIDRNRENLRKSRAARMIAEKGQHFTW